MRVGVVGAGAVGGYFGGRLAEAGNDVAFIARGAHLNGLTSAGLRVESPKGDFALSPVTATDDPAAVGTVDAVLVCVKTWQVADVADAIGPMIGDETVILPLENGVEAARELAAVHGDDRVLGGLCRIMAKIVGPGHIAHVAIEPFVALGELDNRPSERVSRLAAAFDDAGVMVETPADIHAAIWSKFLLMASFGGVGAVTRSPVGMVRSVPETRRMLELAMREIHAVAGAKGIALDDDAVDRTMAFFEGLPADGTSSMQRDILDGRPSELEAHSGAVVKLGNSVGVDTPTHEFIYAALLPMEHDARGLPSTA